MFAETYVQRKIWGFCKKYATFLSAHGNKELSGAFNSIRASSVLARFPPLRPEA